MVLVVKLHCLVISGLVKHFNKTIRQLYYIFAHNTVITDLAPQVAGANRGWPGKIKRNEIC